MDIWEGDLEKRERAVRERDVESRGVHGARWCFAARHGGATWKYEKVLGICENVYTNIMVRFELRCDFI
ncbi:hypothetical protein L484_011737 [Morus notabilis]|uniref:Uncharacterized protein n=1 Tax=Morus notabilis TaxID=981085 RepID=W9RXA3_9ROSA|nr:hypothetical protein L484_011737 [Morus notabilis]